MINYDMSTNKVVCEFDCDEFDDLFWILNKRSDFLKDRIDSANRYLESFDGEPDYSYGEELEARDCFTHEKKVVDDFLEQMLPVIREFTILRPDFEDR